MIEKVRVTAMAERSPVIDGIGSCASA